LTGRTAIRACGPAAAALVSCWIVAVVTGVDHAPAFSWISGLAGRGEAGGQRFALLEPLSGVTFGPLLRRECVAHTGGPAGPNAPGVIQSSIVVRDTPSAPACGAGALR